MRYKIIGRVIKGRETIGYRVLGEDKKERIVSKGDLIKAVKQGIVVNAVYNRSTKTIGGIKGVDLRSLPVIRYSKLIGVKSNGTEGKVKDIGECDKSNSTGVVGKENNIGIKVCSKDIKKKNTSNVVDKGVIKSSRVYSNHDLAKRYEDKQRLMGKRVLDFELIEDDRVMLKRVLDKEDTGRLVIPRFITDIWDLDDYVDTENNGDFGVYGRYLLEGCKYSEVYVDNSGVRDFVTSGLCRGMESNKLKVVFKHPEKVISTMNMFDNCKASELDLSNIDVRNIRNMNYMFVSCYVKKLDLNNWDVSKVECMSGMFWDCIKLEELNVSNWDVRNVKIMNEMFDSCRSLKTIDLSSWDVGNVRNMRVMFECCESLEGVNISGWDISNVDISGIFFDCESLEWIDISKWSIGNIEKLIAEISINNKCKNLKVIYVNNKYVSNVRRLIYNSNLDKRYKIVGV